VQSFHFVVSSRWQACDEPGHHAMVNPVGYANHSCTDIICVLIFAVCFAGLVPILIYAKQNGDVRRIWYGLNYEHQLCGVDLPDQQYVFWCKKQGGTLLATATGFTNNLDFEHPICVSECPKGSDTMNNCWSAVGQTAMVPDYETKPWMGKWCLPEDPALKKGYQDQISNHKVSKYLKESVESAKHGWTYLVGGVILAIILGYLYIFLVRLLAPIIVYASMVGMIVLPALVGAYLIYAYYNDGVDGIPLSGDGDTDLYVGCFCLGISALFLIVAICSCKSIGQTINVVKTAGVAMFKNPSLLLEPMINMVIKLTTWANLLMGLVLLISVGQPQSQKVYRTFEYKNEEWGMIIFYIVMCFWISDLVTAIGQFVVAYAVQVWYFTEQDLSGVKQGVPWCTLGMGYCAALSYHIGTLLFGSAILSIVRLIRVIMQLVTEAMKDQGNVIGQVIASCCLCCVSCFEEMLSFLNKNAYIVCAIFSTPFCESAKNALSIISNNGTSIWLLSGVTWILELAGVCIITTLCFLCGLWSWEIFGKDVATDSKYHIEDPVVIAILTGAVGFLVAVSFMLCFSAVADSLIICFAVERQDGRENPITEEKTHNGWFSSMYQSEKREEPPARAKYGHDELYSLLDETEQRQ